MSEVKLYIACSLDGYIARPNGELDWLNALPNPNSIDYGYNAFIEGIDTIIMGRSTYEEILGFRVEWPYGNCKTYIVTSNVSYTTITENTFVLNEINELQIGKLRSESQKDLWIVGGGQLITAFLNLNAIDEMQICIIPTIIGEGIQLFPKKPKETTFNLIKSESFATGTVMLTYRKRNFT
jgi:dihydrofolate reductase